MIFGVELIEELEKLDPAIRTAFLKILRLIEQTIGDVVKRQDFLELKKTVEALSENVSELSKNLKELAQAQKRTEEKVAELALAQQRTEEKIAELAEAQKQSEQRLTRLEQTVAELAEAQKRTEESLKKLTEEHKKTKEHLGGLSNTVGYILENEVYNYLPKLLMEDFGITVEGRLIRDFIEISDNKFEEINILGKGKKDGKSFTIIGEAKTQLKKSDVDAFLKKLSKIEKVFKEEKILLLVTHQVLSPYVPKYAQQKGINKIYFSYQFV